MQNKLFTQIDTLNKDARTKIHRNPDKALLLAEEAISRSEKINYTKGLADGTFVKAWGLIVKNRIKSSGKNGYSFFSE